MDTVWACCEFVVKAMPHSSRGSRRKRDRDMKSEGNFRVIDQASRPRFEQMNYPAASCGVLYLT